MTLPNVGRVHSWHECTQRCDVQAMTAHLLCLPIKDALPRKDVSGKTYEEDFEDRLQGTSAQ